MIRWLVCFLACLAGPAMAQEDEIVAALSQNRIAISSNFTGTEILVFGAIRRQGPVRMDDLGIIVAIQGPEVPVTVRRKDRVAGVWANRDSVDIDRAPSFYAVNTSGPLNEILTQVADLRHSITVQRTIRAIGASARVEDPNNFTEALVRIRQADRLYQTNIGDIRIREETLFDTAVSLPANLTEGVYTARIFLTRDGMVIHETSSAIFVEKVGLERLLYSLAHDDPLIYGLVSILIAAAAGWSASAVFRYLQS